MCKCIDGCGECVPQLKQPMPHKHAALIKAWADGAKIELRNPKCPRSNWWPEPEPRWNVDCEYRIKPEPKPDVVVDRRIALTGKTHGSFFTTYIDDANVQFVFDGETGKLKDVCLIK